jgi:hypothetical protein
MPTTVLTSLDALTGPTSANLSMTNASDSAPNTMGCNIAGSNGQSGSMISSQSKTGSYDALVIASMTVDFDGALIAIPANAQIYRVNIVASCDYSQDAIAVWGRTGGVASGTASGGVTAALSGSGIFNPTTTPTIVNDGFTDSSGGSVNHSFSLGGSDSDSSVNLERDFVFEPPGTNIQAPSGYITRSQLVAQFTNMSITMGISASGNVTTGVGAGTYQVDSNGTLVISSWVMRVFWNPGFTVTDILPDPAPSTPTTITIEGTDLDGLDDLTLVVDGTTFPITPIIQNTTQIVFVVETGVHVGTATIFSGSVELGTLTIYLASGSGIYRIVKNKRNDTQYDRSTPSATIDVAIPEPFGETGFIGG